MYACSGIKECCVLCFSHNCLLRLMFVMCQSQMGCAFVLLALTVLACLCVCVCVCVSFGSRLLPLVSKAFHSEPDKIPPAYTAAIRQRTMQSSLQANAHTLARSHTDRHRWVSASWCVCVVCNIAEELITHQEFYFFFFYSHRHLSRKKKCHGRRREMHKWIMVFLVAASYKNVFKKRVCLQ